MRLDRNCSKVRTFLIFLVFAFLISACSNMNHKMRNDETHPVNSSERQHRPPIAGTFGTLPHNPNLELDFSGRPLRTIYLAGGCFWGVEAYMARIYGVYDTVSGYANGIGENPSYEDVILGDRLFAETVRVEYDPARVSLEELLAFYFKAIDPTLLNRQGNDRGVQYRTGIYYVDERDLPVIQSVIHEEQKKYDRPIVTEVEPLRNFYEAEEEHQDYLEKNPFGYCHIDLGILEEPVTVDPDLYATPSPKAVDAKEKDYRDHFAPGIYVDAATGEPLFSSRDKYDAVCDGPAFSAPIVPEVVTFHQMVKEDETVTEVRSRVGGVHLGYVYDDGPKEALGLRFCIESGALEFIPYDEMYEKGYGHLRVKVE